MNAILCKDVRQKTALIGGRRDLNYCPRMVKSTNVTLKAVAYVTPDTCSTYVPTCLHFHGLKGFNRTVVNFTLCDYNKVAMCSAKLYTIRRL
jgi:hypothetical protein